MGAARVDSKGHAYKGSQRQVQTWVNHHPDELNSAIATAKKIDKLAPQAPNTIYAGVGKKVSGGLRKPNVARNQSLSATFSTCPQATRWRSKASASAVRTEASSAT